MSPSAPATAALITLLASCAVRAEGVLDDVLAADRAFAARAADSGTQAAFVEFLASDAVLFRPSVVNGQEWLRTHEEATGRLEWSPATGFASCDGQSAVTLGPWTYRQDASSESGFYLTVWRKSASGAWEVVLDHGVDGPPGAPRPGNPAAFPMTRPAAAAGTCAPGGHADGLASADATLDAAIEKKGVDAALRRVLVPGALELRDGHAPAPPSTDWPRDDADLGAPLDATTRGVATAPGSDLGYTYGELARRGQGKASGEVRAVFLRIWVRDGKSWRVAADMLTPLPVAVAPTRDSVIR